MPNFHFLHLTHNIQIILRLFQDDNSQLLYIPSQIHYVTFLFLNNFHIMLKITF